MTDRVAVGDAEIREQVEIGRQFFREYESTFRALAADPIPSPADDERPLEKSPRAFFDE